MKNSILAVALLMALAPMFAKAAPVQSPPQTFALTKDGACSITSSKLTEQFRVPGIIKGWTYYDITWSAKWETTGCKLPMFVQVAFNYLNFQKQVVFTRYWSIEVPKEHFVARGELSEKTQVTAQIGSVRLMKIELQTEDQYNAAHKKP